MMRKFLALFVLTLLCVSGWADFTPKTVEGNTAYYYTLNCQASDHSGFIGLTDNSFNGRSAVGTLFAFEPTGDDGHYYIKSLVRGKYLNAEDGITFDAAPTTFWTIGASGSNIFLYANGDNTKYLNNATTSGMGIQLKNANGACSQWTPTEYAVTLPLPTVDENTHLLRFKNKASGNYMAVNNNGGLVIADKAENTSQWFYLVNTGNLGEYYFASAVDGRTAKETGQSSQFTMGYGNNKAFKLDPHTIGDVNYVAIRQADRAANANNSSMHRSYSNVVAWSSTEDITASMWEMETVNASEFGEATEASIIEEAILRALDGATIALSTLKAEIETELAKEMTIGMPAQSVRDALQTANTNATSSAGYEALKDAYNAYKSSTKLNVPSGYYYMKAAGSDNRTPGGVFNDFSKVTTYTIQEMNASATKDNRYIWHIETNQQSTAANITNGQGSYFGRENQMNLTRTFGAYNQKDGIYFTENFHAVNNDNYNFLDATRGRVIITWGDVNTDQSRWIITPVEDPNIYTVVVKGADAYVTYTKDEISQYAYNGGFFNAESISENELSADDIDGFTKNISLDGNTITVTYVNNTLDFSKPYIIKNKNAQTYIATNLGSANEENAEKFIKIATGNTATYNEVEYDCFKLFSVGSLAYVGKSSAGEDLTTEGAKKFGLVNAAADAVEFIYVGEDDIIPVVNGTASTKAWNWHGGADANNPVGLFTTGDNNSTWEFVPQFAPGTYTITFHVKQGETVIGDVVIEDVEEGATPALTVPEYVTINGYEPEVEACTGDAEYIVTTSLNETAPFKTDGTKYTIKWNSYYANTLWARTTKQSGDVTTVLQTYDRNHYPEHTTQDYFNWTFTGDWLNGFQITNVANGKRMAANSATPDNMSAVQLTEDNDYDDFLLVKSGSKWIFKLAAGNTYIAYTSQNSDALGFWNAEDYQHNEATIAVAPYIGVSAEEVTALQKLINSAVVNSCLNHNPGYPIYPNFDYEDPENAEKLNLLYHTYYDMLDENNHIKDDNYDDALAAYQAVSKLTRVNLPKEGNAYKVAFLQKDGTKQYIAKKNVVGSAVTTSADNAAIFVLGNSKEFTNGGEPGTAIQYILVDQDDRTLSTNGNNTGVRERAEGYAGGCAFALVKALNQKDYCNYGSYTDEQNLACFSLVMATHQENNTGAWLPIGLNNSNNNITNVGWSKTTADVTTAVLLEPITYTYNKPKLANVSGEGYASVYLPFAMTIPAGVEAYAATGDNSEKILLNKEADGTVAKDLPAGGYILYTENADIIGKNITILPAASNPEPCEINLFVGSVDTEMTTVPENAWGLGAKNGIGFYRYSSSVYPYGKALYISDSMSPRFSFGFGDEDDLTGINSSISTSAASELRDLMGNKVVNPIKGQIYIQNGKAIKY